MIDRAAQFEAFKPRLTGIEVSRAIKRERTVLSFSGIRATNEALQTEGVAIKFRFGNRSAITIVFDSYAFSQLAELAEAVRLVDAELAAASAAKKH